MINPAVFQRRMSEADMEAGIRDLVTIYGGRIWHVKDARLVPELTDLPDLIVICGTTAALLELKSQKRRLTFGQEEVSEMLKSCTRFVGGVVRPVPREGEIGYDDVLRMLAGGVDHDQMRRDVLGGL